jgi:hypothetical protein
MNSKSWNYRSWVSFPRKAVIYTCFDLLDPRFRRDDVYADIQQNDVDLGFPPARE